MKIISKISYCEYNTSDDLGKVWHGQATWWNVNHSIWGSRNYNKDSPHGITIKFKYE